MEHRVHSYCPGLSARVIAEPQVSGNGHTQVSQGPPGHVARTPDILYGENEGNYLRDYYPTVRYNLCYGIWLC